MQGRVWYFVPWLSKPLPDPLFNSEIQLFDIDPTVFNLKSVKQASRLF